MVRRHNFGAGPAALPLEALTAAQAELLDHRGLGASVMELSHRSPEYQSLHEEVIGAIRELLGLPEGFQVLLLHGGGRLQFAMVPLNLLNPGRCADYILTGRWSEAALADAWAVGPARVAGGGAENGNYGRIPTRAELRLDPAAVYCHLTSNNTIEGTQWRDFPDAAAVPLVADMSSDLLSRRFDPRPFGLIYAAAQKNLGPAGMSVVIVRADLLDRCREDLPAALQYKVHARANSLYGTPPVFPIYMAALTLRWLRAKGGVAAMEQESRAKSQCVYDVVDRAGGFYRGAAAADSRSLMNVVFRLPDAALEVAFLAEATRAGFIGLKGHRSVGGVRVSLYNAVSLESARALAEFMAEFARIRG